MDGDIKKIKWKLKREREKKNRTNLYELRKNVNLFYDVFMDSRFLFYVGGGKLKKNKQKEGRKTARLPAMMQGAGEERRINK